MHSCPNCHHTCVERGRRATCGDHRDLLGILAQPLDVRPEVDGAAHGFDLLGHEVHEAVRVDGTLLLRQQDTVVGAPFEHRGVQLRLLELCLRVEDHRCVSSEFLRVLLPEVLIQDVHQALIVHDRRRIGMPLQELRVRRPRLQHELGAPRILVQSLPSHALRVIHEALEAPRSEVDRAKEFEAALHGLPHRDASGSVRALGRQGLISLEDTDPQALPRQVIR
mmetsp:Transcript_36974/g.94403  ORF Transcript_36974/g.94403 Transcript_36974/m.94403 type:complete len:223 (-) Transcript_36974:170-838(-)